MPIIANKGSRLSGVALRLMKDVAIATTSGLVRRIRSSSHSRMA